MPRSPLKITGGIFYALMSYSPVLDAHSASRALASAQVLPRWRSLDGRAMYCCTGQYVVNGG